MRSCWRRVGPQSDTMSVLTRGERPRARGRRQPRDEGDRGWSDTAAGQRRSRLTATTSQDEEGRTLPGAFRGRWPADSLLPDFQPPDSRAEKASMF